MPLHIVLRLLKCTIEAFVYTHARNIHFNGSSVCLNAPYERLLKRTIEALLKRMIEAIVYFCTLIIS